MSAYGDLATEKGSHGLCNVGKLERTSVAKHAQRFKGPFDLPSTWGGIQSQHARGVLSSQTLRAGIHGAVLDWNLELRYYSGTNFTMNAFMMWSPVE